nr:cardiolipin synthase [Paenibacillus hamazuiensis]
MITVSNLFLAATVIFLERRNVGTTWAWLMILLFLPGLGFILYLMVGQNLSKRKIYRVPQAQLEHMASLIEIQKEDFKERRIAFNDPSVSEYRDFIYMNLTGGHSFFTQDNRVVIYTEGGPKFDALLQRIEEAQDHIHLMYYIVRDDLIGTRVMDLLTRKAKEGVEVRFLYDDIGSAGIPRRYFQEFKEAGGMVAAFFPSRIPYVNFRLNYRNHRKLAIIDGKYGFIGGFNIGDEYLGLDPRFGEWRDTHLQIHGSAVFQMQVQFILDWNLASERKLKTTARYFVQERHEGSEGVQVLSSGPNNDREQIKNAYIKLIHSAKEKLYLQTPYFVPDESVLTALKLAALSGVDVRLMLPGKPDSLVVYWASYSYLGDLLRAGARCFFYEKGFLHAKTIVADGKVGSVGTANIDIRSFKLNFEVNAFIYGGATATQLTDIFERDMAYCTELTLDMYERRPRTAQVKESLTRLLSPLL